jgi:5-methylcytosine-specific restriction enzyme B
MDSKSNIKNPSSYWFVGASWGSEDQSSRFIEEGIWENSYTDKYLEDVKSIQSGDPSGQKSKISAKI